MQENVKNINIDLLIPFENHPFKKRNGVENEELKESVKENGLLEPIIVRSFSAGTYEIISGHRRVEACKELGMQTVPAIVREMSKDEAVIAMVDSNFQREHLLPSEKAFAYKMKLEAMRHQGKTSCQVGTKSRTDEQIAETVNDSARQVQRYIRLTYLIPELLKFVDEERIAFTPAVELSYLPENEQKILAEEIEYTDATPSLSQAQRLRKFSEQGKLSIDTIFAVLSEEKPNQKEQVKFKTEDNVSKSERSYHMKRKNCYIYTRVSTSMQVDGFSLDAQKEKLRRYAEFQDFMIAGEYSDEGKSGKNIEGRPEFQTMLNDISEGKDNVQYVLVFKLSRFGRNAADVLNSLQLMQDYGVNLICVEDGIDSSKDSGKLMISVLSAVAEIERENILVQTMEGRKQKAREGKWNGGFAPYGYELIDGELKIAEDEAEIIRIIYDKFIHTTMGAGTVAKYLNHQGYIKKKRQNGTLDAFTAHFVKLVLDNPIYCGKIAFGRRKTEKIQGSRNEYHVVKQEEYPVYDGIHDAIISEEDWILAQDKRKKTGIKNEKIYSTEHQHLLTGIIKCPICGAGLYGSVNRKRKKDGSFYRDYWYYAC